MQNDIDSAAPDSQAVQPRKPRKGIYVLPNLVTLAALFAGFYAIVMAMNGRYEMAVVGVFVPWCWTVWMAAWHA